MKKKIHTLMSLSLLVALCFAFTAQAQVVAKAEIPGDDKTESRAADPVVALTSMPAVSEAWIEQADRQFAASLKSPIEAVRVKTMQDVIYIARFHSDKVTLEKVVSPLLGVYIFDQNKSNRLMALSALHALGDPYGMQRLQELVNDEPSEQVRRLTHRALADYYGPKNR